MTTVYITHPAFLEHRTPPGHPERPDRIRAVWAALEAEAFRDLHRMEAPLGDLSTVALVHEQAYIDAIHAARPTDDLVALDPDTVMSAGSWEAALRAVGAVTLGVDEVMGGHADNAFCAVRPPGHHAETMRAMGFCLFNHVAAAARYAQRKHGVERVAIMDFDVHHGNGTQEIFWEDPTVLYTSTHQMPLYPGTGARSETGVGNIVNAPLRPGDGGAEFRAAMESAVLPAIDGFAPDLVLISAGFDAHRRDPLGGLNLVEDDFVWATRKLMELAGKHAKGRVVSALEGGYDLRGLADSAGAHVTTLLWG